MIFWFYHFRIGHYANTEIEPILIPLKAHMQPKIGPASEANMGPPHHYVPHQVCAPSPGTPLISKISDPALDNHLIIECVVAKKKTNIGHLLKHPHLPMANLYKRTETLTLSHSTKHEGK